MRLGAVIRDAGGSLPPGEAGKLAAELAAIGVTREQATPDVVMKAYLMKQLDIPLDRAVLLQTWETSAVGGMNSLRDAAAAVLTDGGLTPGLRDAVTSLVADLDAWFGGAFPEKTAGLAAGGLVESWGKGMERLIRMLASGQEIPSGMRNMPASSIPDLLCTSPSLDEGDTLAALIRPLRTAVEQLGGSVEAMLSGTRTDGGDVTAVLARFERQLGDIRTAVMHYIGEQGGTGVSSALVDTLFDERLRFLKAHLSDTFAWRSAGEEGSTASPAPGVMTRTHFRNGGMSLEWRLLLWYRAGADPGRLQAVLAEDAKGALLRFLARARKEQGRGSRKSAALVKRAADAVDSISGRQLSTVLADRTGRPSLYMEIPFFGNRDAGVSIRKRNKNDSVDQETQCPQGCTFRVDTSGLGVVVAALQLVDGALHLDLTVDDPDDVDPEGDEVGAMAESLAGKGFAVRSVRIHGRNDASSGGEEKGDTTERIDFAG